MAMGQMGEWDHAQKRPVLHPGRDRPRELVRRGAKSLGAEDWRCRRGQHGGQLGILTVCAVFGRRWSTRASGRLGKRGSRLTGSKLGAGKKHGLSSTRVPCLPLTAMWLFSAAPAAGALPEHRFCSSARCVPSGLSCVPAITPVCSYIFVAASHRLLSPLNSGAAARDPEGLESGPIVGKRGIRSPRSRAPERPIPGDYGERASGTR